MDSLGDRMKKYEKVSDFSLPIRTPIICRVDGRSFHQYTKRCKRPFDHGIINAMWQVAKALCDEIAGAQLAYIQSDEISVLVHYYKKLDSQPFVSNRIQKLCSITAGIASGVMTQESQLVFGEYRRAVFDSRVFSLPEAEVCNYFQWRQNDWTRNSIQMLAHSLYSHKELHKKNRDDLQEMCFQAGSNWNNLSVFLKRGACIVKENFVAEDGATRSRWVVDREIPIFSKDRGYIEKHLQLEES